MNTDSQITKFANYQSPQIKDEKMLKSKRKEKKAITKHYAIMLKNILSKP